MKRILDYFTEAAMKIVLQHQGIHQSSWNFNSQKSGLEIQNTTSNSGSSILVSEFSFWPSWNIKQKNEFLGGKVIGLFFHDGKLGFSVCKNVGWLSAEKNVGIWLSKRSG